MRCLHCRENGIPVTDVTCPKCGAFLPFLMRDVLTPGTPLEGGKYLVDYPLGRGGFGITYRAHHVNLAMPVAIKEFFPREHAMRDGATGSLTVPTTEQGSYHRALERFIGEGRILSQLNHQNVVRVLDSFQERSTAYLVMELLDGSTLRDELDNQPDKRLPPNRVKLIVEQIVSALEAVHSKGIYHLDISPDNVQLKKTGQVVLIDFGAARQGLTSSTTRAFKLAYAAPEVLAGTHVGPQSDLFELGMMIGEMLTGVLPPSVLERMAGVTLNLGMLDETWRSLLDAALRMEIEARPPTVEAWWKSFGGPRPSVVLPVAKSKKITPPAPGPAAESPAKPKLILPDKPKRKFKLGPIRSKPHDAPPPAVNQPRPLAGVPLPSDSRPPHLVKTLTVDGPRMMGGNPYKGPGDVGPHAAAGSAPKDHKTLIAFVCGILASCALGLVAYFVSMEMLRPSPFGPQGDYDETHAQVISIIVFAVIALGAFFGFVMWIFNNRKKRR